MLPAPPKGTFLEAFSAHVAIQRRPEVESLGFWGVWLQSFFPVSVWAQGSLLAFGPLGGVRGGRSGCPKGAGGLFARILRCFLHIRLKNTSVFATEASKSSYFTVFSAWYASKTRVFLLSRLQNRCILQCFLHGMPQKHECFCYFKAPRP